MWKLAFLTLALALFLAYFDLSYAPFALLLPISYVTVSDYLKERKRRKIEEALPRAALELAIRPFITLSDAVRFLSSGFGELSNEFRKAKRMIDQGLPPRRALLALSSDAPPLLRRFIRVLVIGHQSGASWEELLRGCAEDFEHIFAARREAASALALQKYSILLSAAVLVPTVLGIAFRIARNVSLGYMESAYVNVLRVAVPIHIASLVVLSSLFAALVDGNPKEAFFHILLMLPLALGIYFAISI